MATQLPTKSGSGRLATALRSDGVFALLSGLSIAIGARPIASVIGLETPWILVGLGIVLVGYGSLLLYFANREPENRQIARAAVLLNLLWVIGSYAGLLLGLFGLNTAGNWAVALVAEGVFVFAIWEFLAFRREARQGS